MDKRSPYRSAFTRSWMGTNGVPREWPKPGWQSLAQDVLLALGAIVLTVVALRGR